MAQLVVRNIEDDVKARLAERARRHGRSMEEEVRVILRDAVQDEFKTAPELGFGTRLTNFFAEEGIDYELEELKGNEARPATFD